MSDALPEPLQAMADELSAMTVDELRGMRDEFYRMANDPSGDKQERGFARMGACAVTAQLEGGSAVDEFGRHLALLQKLQAMRVEDERRHTVRRRVRSRRRVRR